MKLYWKPKDVMYVADGIPDGTVAFGIYASCPAGCPHSRVAMIDRDTGTYRCDRSGHSRFPRLYVEDANGPTLTIVDSETGARSTFEGAPYSE